MDDILRMARELGEALAKHPQYQALRGAEDAVKADGEARTLIDEFSRQQEKMLRLTHEQKPIEPEDKHRMTDLQQKVMSNEALKHLQAAQVEFRHLMDNVDRAIRDALEPPDEEQEPQPDTPEP